MSRLIESIRLFNGKFSRLDLHQARLSNSFRTVFGKDPEWKLETLLRAQKIPQEGLYKCRVVYGEQQQVEFTLYEPKPIQTLKLVEGGDIRYDHKWENREQLDNAFAKRGSCDDVLILKNGLITDSYYANVVFKKGNKWYTPQSYLLPGTMRQFLLKTGVIEKRVISEKSFKEFERFKLINAMLEWDGPEIDIDHIE